MVFELCLCILLYPLLDLKEVDDFRYFYFHWQWPDSSETLELVGLLHLTARSCLALQVFILVLCLVVPGPVVDLVINLIFDRPKPIPKLNKNQPLTRRIKFSQPYHVRSLSNFQDTFLYIYQHDL